MAAEDDKNLVEILEDLNPVDVAKYMNFVSAPQAGAIATFSGTTRDTFEGKTILELRYEAYVPMAIRCIKADALEACRYLIDEIKATIPIWKKEVYSNGEVWKENTEFLDRRYELGNKDVACYGKRAEIKEHKRLCCGTKVRVDDEGSQD
ncbi:Molybdopterin biosynthesis MoaE [Sesbania bispinosa]|nr:Molybdopterin biosynthesis MoaE [Sesbania bispinosa]